MVTGNFCLRLWSWDLTLWLWDTSHGIYCDIFENCIYRINEENKKFEFFL